MEQNPLVDFGLPLALFVIMVGVGLSLTVADFRREARAPKGIVVGALAQLVLMPALGFAIAAALRLPAPIAVGLVICAACPGGTVSNLIAYLARANVALSLTLTVIASVVTIATLPIAVNLALSWQAAGLEVGVTVPLDRTIGLLVGVVLVPVALGMLLRRRAPRRAPALERALGRVGGALLVILVVGLGISLRGQIWELVSQAGPASLLLNVGGIGIGVAAAAAAGLPVRDRLTCGIELGMKNVALAILVALTVLGSETAAFPAAMYGLFMYFTGFGLVTFGLRHVPPRGAAPVLVSACLAGRECTYRATANPRDGARALADEGRAVLVCPEEEGGLPTPRPPAEIVGGDGHDVLDGRARVITLDGEDVTAAYLQGAQAALERAQEAGAASALLKARSPSCGCREIYDGTFTRTRRAGPGVTAALLQRAGIDVRSDEDT